MKLTLSLSTAQAVRERLKIQTEKEVQIFLAGLMIGAGVYQTTAKATAEKWIKEIQSK